MSTALTILAFLSLLPPLITGFLIVSVLWPKDRPILSDLPLKCSLSVGFGFGTSSFLVFLWIMVVGQLTRGMLVCELMLVGGLGALLAWGKRASVSTAADQPESVSVLSFKSPYLLRVAVGVAALSAAIRFWYLSRLDPHGQFDAFAIWNLRARFLYSGGRYWKNFIYVTELRITHCSCQRLLLDHGSLSAAKHN